MLISLLKKELYIQARNWKIRVFSTFFILVLTILSFVLIWYISTGNASYDPGRGHSIFLVFIIALTILTCLIAPALLFNSISLEKEHNTFCQLKLTWLKPYQIIMGKTGSSVILILILLLISLPIIILMMPLGGRNPVHLIRCYITILATAFSFSMFGLMCSSVFRSSRNSGYVTYFIAGFFIFGTELIPLILSQIFKANSRSSAFTILKMMNPYRAVLNSLDTGAQYELFGLPSYLITVTLFILLSIMAMSIALKMIKKLEMS